MKENIVTMISSADVFTLTNGLLGFWSIIFMYHRLMDLAVITILVAILIDGIDGMVANRFNRKWKLGDYLDIISDCVSFVVAPALMVYISVTDITENEFVHMLSYLICSFIILAGILRLARFCYLSEHNFFVGLPAPAFALVIALVVFIKINTPIYILPLSAVLSFLMISNLRYLKMKGKIGVFSGGVILMCILFQHAYSNIIPIATLLLTMIYILLGTILVPYPDIIK